MGLINREGACFQFWLREGGLLERGLNRTFTVYWVRQKKLSFFKIHNTKCNLWIGLNLVLLANREIEIFLQSSSRFYGDWVLDLCDFLKFLSSIMLVGIRNMISEEIAVFHESEI